MNSLYNNSDSKELNEIVSFSCKRCHNVPEILLENNEYLLIECTYCETNKKEKISNLAYCLSEWISNGIIKLCDLNHKEKIFSIIYCKSCNLFLCQNCYETHKKEKNHIYISLDNLKLEQYIKTLANNNIINEELQNLKNFEIFLEEAKNIQAKIYDYK